MTIKQAKEYIKSTVNLYLKKDEFGEYRIPVVRQRPIFLLGAPGVGKTAVMEQIKMHFDCPGIGHCACFLFHDPSYEAICIGASFY